MSRNELKGLGTESKIDETFLIEQGINVRDLMFFVNTGCNLRCMHCYVGDDKQIDAQFDRKEAINLLTHFARNGLDRLTFLGGEPSIYPHISELIRIASSYKIPEVRMTTNGIDISFIDTISHSDLDHISFSVDGHNAVLHDYIRGKGTFDQVMLSIRKAQDKGFTTNITYSVNKINLNFVEESLYFFKERGITEVNFHLTSMVGDAKKHDDLYVKPREWVNLRERLLKPKKGLEGLRLRVPLMFLDKEEYKAELEKGYTCLINGSYHSQEGGNRILLYPTGKTYVCCMLSSSDFNFGFFKNGRFLPNASPNELSELNKHPKHPCIATKLLGVDTGGYVPVCISYKKKITL